MPIFRFYSLIMMRDILFYLYFSWCIFAVHLSVRFVFQIKQFLISVAATCTSFFNHNTCPVKGSCLLLAQMKCAGTLLVRCLILVFFPVLLVVLKYLDAIIIIVCFANSSVINTWMTLYLCMIPVLLVVFKYLDDISLWTAGLVCLRWQQLLQGETTDSRWHDFIKLRWPLFNPSYKVKNWKTIYTKL